MDTNLETKIADRQEASGSRPANIRQFRDVEKWDYRRSSGLLQTKSDALVRFYQGFVRNLSRSLGVFLSTPVEMELSETKESIYDDFLATLTPGSFMTSFRLEAQPVPLILHLNAEIASPILDLLLGGTAESACSRSELSDVDAHVLAEVSRVIARELEISWRAPELKLRNEMSLSKAARQQLAGSAAVLLVSVNVKLAGAAGLISIVQPSTIAESVMRGFELHSEQIASPGITIAQQSTESLRQITVNAELVLPPVRVPIRVLTSLEENSVVALPLAADQPAMLAVAGLGIFSALPVRRGNVLAAKLEKAMSQNLRNLKAGNL